MAKETPKQATEIPIEQLIPRPKIEVLERGLQNVFGLPSAPIELKDPAMVCHWVNTSISGGQLGKYLDAGYLKVRPEMLADTDRVAFQVSPEGYVTRGQRHEEILMYTFKDHFKKRQWEKARRNRDSMNPYTTKQEVVAAASGKLGDEAADYLNRHVGPVGAWSTATNGLSGATRGRSERVVHCDDRGAHYGHLLAASGGGAVILASGAFDGLHSGHVEYLRQAAAVDHLQKLLVAIAPDTYVEHEKLRKVMWTQAQRSETVLALRCVDATIDQMTNSVAPLILDLKPSYFVKGEDWVGKLPQDVLDACAEVGAEIVFVKADGTHTSEARG